MALDRLAFLLDIALASFFLKGHIHGSLNFLIMMLRVKGITDFVLVFSRLLTWRVCVVCVVCVVLIFK